MDYPDDDTLVDNIQANFDDIGTIRVSIFLLKGWHRDLNRRKFDILDHPPAVINERTKKRAEHCVS